MARFLNNMAFLILVNILATTGYTENLLWYVDEGYIAVFIFIQYSKSFNTVDHYKLLAIICNVGFKSVCNKYLFSYMNGREQYVEIKSFYRVNLNAAYGVRKVLSWGLYYVTSMFRTFSVQNCKGVIFHSPTILLLYRGKLIRKYYKPTQPKT